MTLLACIGRYAERERFRWMRDALLHPAGHRVLSTWINGPDVTDEQISDKDATKQVRRNGRELYECDAVLYLPAWVPTPGRFVDLGIAWAYHKPIIVLGVKDWASLPECERTIYLHGAEFVPEETEIVARLTAMALD